MKISKNFIIQEFVPKQTFEHFGESSVWLIDPKLINLMQQIRDYFGKSITINNWHSGGNFNYRGFRDDSFYYQWDNNLSAYKSKSKGKFSQHRMGRAVDFNIDGITPDEVRAEFMKNESQWLEMGLTTIEDGKFAPTWVHLDIRFTGKNSIFVVKP